MALFDRIGKSIRQFFTPKEERQILQPKVEPKQRWLTRLQKFFQPKEEKQILEPKVEPLPKTGREADALRAAIDMIIKAGEHTGDPTYDKAREEALVYINKSQNLTNKGATQTGNRRYIADRYLKSELSTAQGVEQRKERMLETFNANFGFDLTREQADTVGQLMKSDSFKKLMEQYREKYDIIIGMVGDNIELGADPVRIEQQLDLWQQVGMEPDFSAFQNVTALDNEDFQALREEMLIYNEESIYADDYQRREDINAILGRYVTW
jgi:hypothetical protein